MNDRMQVFTRDEINLIHDASMEILEETGIKFNSGEALELFRQNGFKVTNPRVYLTEKRGDACPGNGAVAVRDSRPQPDVQCSHRRR